MFNSFLSSSVLAESTISTEEFEAIPVTECYDDPLDACMRIAYESTENFNRITKALAMDELKYFQENGVEYIYEAKDGKNIFQRFSEWIKNIWSKIQGVIKSFIEKIQDKDIELFMKKNGDAISKLGSSFTFKEPMKMYTYNKDLSWNPTDLNDAMKKASKSLFGIEYTCFLSANGVELYLNQKYNLGGDAASVSALANITQEISEKKKGLTGELIKHLSASANAKLTDAEKSSLEEFSKGCIRAFRSAQKEEIKTINPSNLKADLEGCRAAMKSAKEVYTSNQKFFKQKLDEAKKLEKSFEKEMSADKKQNKDKKYKNVPMEAKIQFATIGKEIVKSAININSALLRANLYAIKHNRAQDLALLKAALRQSGKGTDAAGEKQQTATGESANFFFNNLELL